MSRNTPNNALRMVGQPSGTKDTPMIGRADDVTTITLAYDIKR